MAKKKKMVVNSDVGGIARRVAQRHANARLGAQNPQFAVAKPVSSYKPSSSDRKAASLAGQYQRESDMDRRAAQGVSQQFLNRSFQGIQPRDRQYLQETANSNLNNYLQGQRRQLLGQQGLHGVRGGAAYAQQADLARMGAQARQQTQRDLNVADIEERNKNRATAYGIESGEQAQRALSREQARDVTDANRLEKQQKRYARKANQLFSRI